MSLSSSRRRRRPRQCRSRSRSTVNTGASKKHNNNSTKPMMLQYSLLFRLCVILSLICMCRVFRNDGTLPSSVDFVCVATAQHTSTMDGNENNNNNDNEKNENDVNNNNNEKNKIVLSEEEEKEKKETKTSSSSSNSNSDDAMAPVEEQLFDMIVDLQTSWDPFVEYITGSWFRYTGAYRVAEEQEQEQEEEKKNQQEKNCVVQQQQQPSSSNDDDTDIEYTARQSSNNDEDTDADTDTTRQCNDEKADPNNASNNTPADTADADADADANDDADEIIEWDDEEDIHDYLTFCHQKETSPKACLQALHNLVRAPLCTMRLDSRYLCQRQSQSQAQSGDTNENENENENETMTLPQKQKKNRKQKLQRKQRSLASILGPEYFSEETINIVIVGCGPVGLFLANMLTEVNLHRHKEQQQYQHNYHYRKHQHQQQQSGRRTTPPPPLPPPPPLAELRIVMVENRVHEEGHKKPYQRTWMTGIGPSSIWDAIDPRLLKLFSTLFGNEDMGYVKDITLPINFWETLLLLSNRQRGVQFLYGKNILEENGHYLQDTPNLLIVDATGHRLAPLQRYAQPDFDTKPSEMFAWQGSSPEKREYCQERWQFPEVWIEGVPGYLVPQKIAHRHAPLGSLLYPVLPSGKAYFIHRFDIMNLPPIADDIPNEAYQQTTNTDAEIEDYDYAFHVKEETPEFINRLQVIEEQVRVAFRLELGKEVNDDLHDGGVGPPLQGSRFVYYDEKETFAEQYRTVLLKDDQFLGIYLRSLGIKPTPAQGLLFEELLRNYTKVGELDLPLSRIPLADFLFQNIHNPQSTTIFKENQIEEVLRLAKELSQSSAGEPVVGSSQPQLGPWISGYRSRPYLYTDPVVSGGYSLNTDGQHGHGHGQGRYLPMIRIGDSLFVGDVDISSGLNAHMTLIRKYFCRLIGDDLCFQDLP